MYESSKQGSIPYIGFLVFFLIMKGRGKGVEIYNDNKFSDSSFDQPCKKHPNSSPVGICAYCLKDRLMKLVCSDCGEQRLSSCSCSDDVASYRNSCSVMEVGSVGRISFLIENERFDDFHEFKLDSKPKRDVKDRSDDVTLLKRSSSSCVEIKKSSGFWKVGKLFKKNRGKQSDGDICNDKTDIQVADLRSKSLSSFRGSVFNDPDQESNDFAISSAKVSDVYEAEPRRSAFLKRVLLQNPKHGMKDSRCSGASSLGAQKSEFSLKESDFSNTDGSEFIDLNLDSSNSCKTECSAASVSKHFGTSIKEDRLMGHGGSCRITVNEKNVQKGSKGQKVWRWILSQPHQHGWKNLSKKDENHSLYI